MDQVEQKLNSVYFGKGLKLHIETQLVDIDDGCACAGSSIE